MSVRDRLYESLNQLDSFLADREEEYDAVKLVRLRSLLIRALYWTDRRIAESYFERREREDKGKTKRGGRKR
jgi:hypothetical protein